MDDDKKKKAMMFFVVGVCAVLSVTSVCNPPITPATATGFSESHIISICRDNFLFSLSRVNNVSAEPAVFTTMRFPESQNQRHAMGGPFPGAHNS